MFQDLKLTSPIEAPTATSSCLLVTGPITSSIDTAGPSTAGLSAIGSATTTRPTASPTMPPLSSTYPVTTPQPMAVSCPFLALTPVIRREIYKHLLQTARFTHQHTGKWSLELAILRTTREIHSEAVRYLHQANSFALLKLDKGADLVLQRAEEVVEEAARYSHVVSADTTVTPDLVIRIFGQEGERSKRSWFRLVIVLTWDLPEICRQLTIVGDEYTIRTSVTLMAGVSERIKWWSLRCLAEVRNMRAVRLRGRETGMEGGQYDVATVQRTMVRDLKAGDILSTMKMYGLEAQRAGPSVYQKRCILVEAVKYFDQIADFHAHLSGEKSLFSAEDGERMDELAVVWEEQAKSLPPAAEGI